jgi:hypothetical protein
MATITEIVRNGKGTAGSNGAWRVYTRPGDDDWRPDSRELYHYSTLMLEWDDEGVIDYSIGYGSVSDQGGMNKAFRALGVPFRYDRDERGGGARITTLEHVTVS